MVTANHALDAMGMVWLPVMRTWRLNERHYGALQGLDKKETTERHGAEQTHLWRRSYDVPPPPVDLDSPEHPRNDGATPGCHPTCCRRPSASSTSIVRVLPYWYDTIVPQLGAVSTSSSSRTATACAR